MNIFLICIICRYFYIFTIFYIFSSMFEAHFKICNLIFFTIYHLYLSELKNQTQLIFIASIVFSARHIFLTPAVYFGLLLLSLWEFSFNMKSYFFTIHCSKFWLRIPQRLILVIILYLFFCSISYEVVICNFLYILNSCFIWVLPIFITCWVHKTCVISLAKKLELEFFDPIARVNKLMELSNSPKLCQLLHVNMEWISIRVSSMNVIWRGFHMSDRTSDM